MASTSELYSQSASLAIQAGVDDFGKVMPRHRFADMTSDRMINSAWYRRPTEAEWKRLKGEA